MVCFFNCNRIALSINYSLMLFPIYIYPCVNTTMNKKKVMIGVLMAAIIVGVGGAVVPLLAYKCGNGRYIGSTYFGIPVFGCNLFP